jgi:hypothetical protein
MIPISIVLESTLESFRFNETNINIALKSLRELARQDESCVDYIASCIEGTEKNKKVINKAIAETLKQIEEIGQ